MKHKSFIPLLGFFLLLGAASCTEPINVNPNYNAETKEVTTQFVLNVNTGSPQTKMTAEVVQMDENFRGIEDAKLYVYKSNISSGTPYVLDTTAPAEKYFDFGKFLSDGALNNTGTNNETGASATASKRILQLSIPVGVDAILFYGKAIKAGGAKDEDFGATNTDATTFSSTPRSTEIAAKKILTDGAVVNSYDATARLMIAVINDLMARSVGEYNDDTFGLLPAVTWAQYGHQYEIDSMKTASRYPSSMAIGHKLEGLEEVLGKCYFMFTYILPANTDRPHGEYRAGSSFSVKKMVMDMYRVLSSVASATPTTAREANAKRLAGIIIDRANLYFNSDTTDEIPDGDYKTVSELYGLLVTSYKIYTDAQWTALFAGAANLNGYPYEDFGVPEGAAQLGFYYQGEADASTSHVFERDSFYYHHPNFPLVNPNMATFEPRKYLYPAELWYYVNSPVRTTDNEVTNDSYPDGVTPWNTGVIPGTTASKWTGWTFPGKVASSTRGVAVANSVNYGVAMLKTNVVYNATTLQDNRAKLTDNKEANKSIDVSSSLFELRGVLVGGVNPRMGWQFTRKYKSGEFSAFDGVIYDHSLASNAVPSTAPNYTLVYDNYNSSGSGALADQNNVYVALEFVNKGENFYGRDNMIPSGGVFYLVGMLNKPNDTTASDLEWPTDHQIPPVWGVNGETVPSGEKAGESKQIARVFIQDFMTSATFRIGTTSLQNAYYSVPDLRASQMSLGLSVDLKWTPGFSYTLDL